MKVILVLIANLLALSAFATPDGGTDSKSESGLAARVVNMINSNRIFWDDHKISNLAETLHDPKVLAAVKNTLFLSPNPKCYHCDDVRQGLAIAEPELILPSLIECYKKGVRECHAVNMGNIGFIMPSKILPVLIDVAKNDVTDTKRRDALRGIVIMRSGYSTNKHREPISKEQHQEIFNLMRDSLADSSPIVRLAATSALMWSDSRQEGFAVVNKAFENESDYFVRSHIIITLKRYGYTGGDQASYDKHFATIKSMALNENLHYESRLTAIGNLRSLGVVLHKEEEALPVVMKILEENVGKDANFRFVCLTELDAYEKHLKPYLNKLKEFNIKESDETLIKYFYDPLIKYVEEM